ncbi:glycine-rich domain-containing protein [Streptomyces sp. NBC_01451]|uniref:glycine-rich domain-containing protein n=1 Tax=Streptomyces sp. NBC_01451 TaxID=2903872 RepID=UPI002E31FD50|nr:hypothetical protein [Streptomyces sp. NBC_01451]
MATALETPAPAPAAGPESSPFTDPHSHITPELWNKQVALLMRDYPYDDVMATRVLGQAYAYMLTAMASRGRGQAIGPGHIVDIGVHTVILDTVAYAELCDRYNDGVFLHHVPLVGMKTDRSVVRTAHQIAAHGFEVDLPLWQADAAKCSPCHPGSDSHCPTPLAGPLLRGRARPLPVQRPGPPCG